MIVRVTDRPALERVLRRNTLLHLYEIGDLDDFFWPNTTWYGMTNSDTVTDVALVYDPGNLPVLLFLPGQVSPAHLDFLNALVPVLPKRFYCHLTPGLARAFRGSFRLQAHGTHHKMGLVQVEKINDIDTSGVEALSASHRGEVRDIYGESYPGNWFDERMLETGCYFGWRENGKLACIAGIHVYSAVYRVASLGNITTHPAYRGRGLATLVTAALCRHLLQSVTHIGLNVVAGNQPAIACYRRIGFEKIAEYEEYLCLKHEA